MDALALDEAAAAATDARILKRRHPHPADAAEEAIAPHDSDAVRPAKPVRIVGRFPAGIHGRRRRPDPEPGAHHADLPAPLGCHALSEEVHALPSFLFTSYLDIV